jgi:hypothetical protein
VGIVNCERCAEIVALSPANSTVTFPDGSAISSTDEDTTIANKSFVYGYFAPKENPVFSGNNVTFPDSSKITDYLK